MAGLTDWHMGCLSFPDQNISKSSMLWQGWGATGVGGSDLANVNIGFRSTFFFAGIKTLTGSPLGKLYDFQQESKFSLLHVEEPPAFCESTPDSTSPMSQVR